jgi:hypothetical protein
MRSCPWRRADRRQYSTGEIQNMKKFMSIMLGLSLIIGSATVAFAADDKKDDKKTEKKKKKGNKKDDKKS